MDPLFLRHIPRTPVPAPSLLSSHSLRSGDGGMSCLFTFLSPPPLRNRGCPKLMHYVVIIKYCDFRLCSNVNILSIAESDA